MFKKLTEGARLPERATKYSAGFDVFANEDAVIGAGETKLIGLGIALDNIDIQGLIFELMHKNEIPIDARSYYLNDFLEKHYFALHIRSSLRAKGLTSLGTGIIDMDYRDEIKMIIHNPIKTVFPIDEGDGLPLCIVSKAVGGSKGYEIKKGDKIGQLILCRHEGWMLPAEYTKDEERTGGFGSTGG